MPGYRLMINRLRCSRECEYMVWSACRGVKLIAVMVMLVRISYMSEFLPRWTTNFTLL